MKTNLINELSSKFNDYQILDKVLKSAEDRNIKLSFIFKDWEEIKIEKHLIKFINYSTNIIYNLPVEKLW